MEINVKWRLLTTEQAAEYLGLSKKTLEKNRCIGINSPTHVKIGSSVRYRLSDLDDFIINHTITCTGKEN